MTKQQRKILIKIIIGAVLFAVAMAVTHLLTLLWWAELLIFLAVYLVPGFSVLEKAVRNIAHGQVFDENFLMTIGLHCGVCHRAVSGGGGSHPVLPGG